MKKCITKSLGGLAPGFMLGLILSMGAGNGSAATTTYHTATYIAQVPDRQLNWEEYVQLPKFNPTLGTLTKVIFRAEADITFYLKMENRSRGSQQYNLDFVATIVAVNVEGPTILSTLRPSGTFEATLKTWDKVLDFGGTSGITFPPYTDSDENLLEYTDPAMIAQFIAAPGSDRIVLRAATASQVKGTAAGGNTTILSSARGSTFYTIVYEYEKEEGGQGEPPDLQGRVLCESDPDVAVGAVAVVVSRWDDVQSAYFDYAMTTTDPSSGSYVVEDLLAPGTYWVSIVPPAGMAVVQTPALPIVIAEGFEGTVWDVNFTVAPETPLAVDIIPSGSGVCDGVTRTLTAETTGGVPPFYFVWTGPDGSTVEGLGANEIEATQAGLYTVLVTDSGVCAGMAEAQEDIVLIPGPPCGIIIPMPLPNPGEQVDLEAIAGAVSYEWTQIDGQDTGWFIVGGEDTPVLTIQAGSSGTATFEVLTRNELGCESLCEITFGLNDGEGCTPGFWHNKNGLKLIDGGDVAFLNSLCLTDCNGPTPDFAVPADVSAWIVNRGCSSMAYTLSAHLAAFSLNVREGFFTTSTVFDTSKIPAQYGGPKDLGVLSATDLIALANSALCDGASKDEMEPIKDVLDWANNNCRR
ncbi:MAG TPA: choice-of-anchor E domain-containing protein [Verrucomicrobiota bacterium]|nr:choice-of-anchor E domain-containing protein [Verrucomicrobiota bacterium]HNU51407.1 choice-of-anchor E domain-containing protein [Verrucomicrobiota bacterium]